MILCQVCHTQNSLEAVSCVKCGAKLLVIGGNQSWDDYTPHPFSLEDHFLERISNLEDTVSNILDHLAQFAENFEHVERNSFVTRSGLTALIDTLKEADQLKEDVLRERWESTIVEQMEEAQVRDRFLQMKGRFLALYRGGSEKESRFKAFIDDAEFLILSGNLDEFLDPLDEALSLDPENYELAYFLAEMSFEMETGDLESYLETALDANPIHSGSLLMLAVLYYSEDRLDESLELLNRALNVNPRDEAALLCVGSILTAQGQFEEARTFLMKSLEYKAQAQCHYLLGIGYKETGSPQKAMKHLEQAIEMNPDLEDAYYMLGFVYLKRGWTRKAKEAFSEALALNPFKIEYQEALNFDQPKAEMDLNQLDDEALSVYRTAEELFQKNKYKAAISQYRQLVKRFPENPVFLGSLAVALFSLQRWPEVIKVCQKLRKLEPSEIFLCIACTLQMESERSMELFDDALITLTEMEASLKSGYGKAITAYGMALTLADLGEELYQAESMALNALDYSPEEFRANLLDALGWVYFKQGKLDECIECLEQSLEIEETANTLQHYGLALLSVNLQDKALDVFAKLLAMRGKEPKVDHFIFRALERESKQLDPPQREE